jgi:hypothetical protein
MTTSASQRRVNRWLVLVVLSLGTFMSLLDLTIHRRWERHHRCAHAALGERQRRLLGDEPERHERPGIRGDAPDHQAGTVAIGLGLGKRAVFTPSS